MFKKLLGFLKKPWKKKEAENAKETPKSKVGALTKSLLPDLHRWRDIPGPPGKTKNQVPAIVEGRRKWQAFVRQLRIRAGIGRRAPENLSPRAMARRRKKAQYEKDGIRTGRAFLRFKVA